MERPTTPPRAPPKPTAATPPTPQVTRRIEENRLKAKARREQHEAAAKAAGVPSPSRTPSGFLATDDVHLSRKRGHDAISRSSSRIANAPSTSRDGRANGVEKGPDASNGADAATKGKAAGDAAASEEIKPARKFTKFVDYDFGKMTDTKGGFLNAEDDPWNKAMSTGPPTKPGQQQDAQSQSQDQRPQGMTITEWERLQLLRKLQRQKAGPFEPGLSVLRDEAAKKKCRECGSLEIDFTWHEVFGCSVCGPCKEKIPEKYSLLTKTEAKEDYLLTDPELRDEDLLPHLSKPNPHKSHWHDMMLFLRFQVEEYAFGEKKWGSAEALDEEFSKREAEKKRRKETKFREKLADLKKRTRTDQYRREHGRLVGGIGKAAGGPLGPGGKGKGKEAKFGDVVPGGGRHVHEWGRVVENEDGDSVKTCVSCGMEVEELEL